MIGKTTRRVASAAILAIASVSANAQVKDINSAINSASNMLRGILDPVITLASYMVGIAAAILVVPALLKHNKGDHTAADSFAKLAGGLLMVFIILQLIKLLVM